MRVDTKTALTREKRQRDCPNCRIISQQSEQRAFCSPQHTSIDIPIDCGRCKFRINDKAEIYFYSIIACPEPLLVQSRQQNNSFGVITQLPRPFHTATLEHFYYGYEGWINVTRQPLCLGCQEVRGKVRRPAICHSLLVRNLVPRACEKFLTRFGQCRA